MSKKNRTFAPKLDNLRDNYEKTIKNTIKNIMCNTGFGHFVRHAYFL